MSTIAIAIVAVFVIGYLCIALESKFEINKAAVAILMCALVWTLYMCDPLSFITSFHGADYTGGAEGATSFVSTILGEHLGETASTLFFLMGAMTIVEIIDSNGGFNFVRDALRTTSKRKLLWKIGFMTFFLSAVLDNLTTSIVMVMVLRKLVADKDDRIVYAALVIIAANAGGAFSPIGDVTTIMLWIGGMISAKGVIMEIFICSLTAMIVPTFAMQYKLKGTLAAPEMASESDALHFSNLERKLIFWVGIGGLIFVPIFHTLTHLPPYMGILLVLGLLWTLTELFYRDKTHIEETMQNRVTKLLSKIDTTTIFFFLGILMAVACLQEISVLANLGKSLDEVSGGNRYIVNGIIGIASSIVDNVPLVAGCMGMYPIEATGDFAVDGLFWQLLAFCAGTGGSLLIIGSAAGVVVMGLEKITFGWYLKNVSFYALLGYLAGMAEYWVEKTYIFA